VNYGTGYQSSPVHEASSKPIYTPIYPTAGSSSSVNYGTGYQSSSASSSTYASVVPVPSAHSSAQSYGTGYPIKPSSSVVYPVSTPSVVYPAYPTGATGYPIKPSASSVAGHSEYPHSDITTTYTKYVTSFVPCSTSVGHNDHSSVIYSTYLTATSYPVTVTETIHGHASTGAAVPPQQTYPAEQLSVVYPAETPKTTVGAPPQQTYPAEQPSVVYPAETPKTTVAVPVQTPGVPVPDNCPAVTVTVTKTETLPAGGAYTPVPGPIKTFTVTEGGQTQIYTATLPGSSAPASAYPEGPKQTYTVKPQPSASAYPSLSYAASSAPYPIVSPSASKSAVPYAVNTPSSSAKPTPVPTGYVSYPDHY
jgi:hypothetical protein